MFWNKNVVISISVFLLVFCVSIPNVHANTKELKEKVIEVLPTEVVIPFNEDFIKNEESYLLYNDNVSRVIVYYLNNEVEKIAKENELNGVCDYSKFGNGNLQCLVSFYISTAEQNMTFNLTFEQYNKYFNEQQRFFTYYYYIYVNNKISDVIPFKVYFDNKNNEDYVFAKTAYDSINDEYSISITDEYSLMYERNDENQHMSYDQLLLSMIGLKDKNDISYSVDHVYSNWNTINERYNLNEDKALLISIKYKEHYYFNKVIKINVDNYIELPSHIIEKDDILKYIYDYYKQLFQDKNIEIKYINDEYILYFNDSAKYLLNVDKNIEHLFSGGDGTISNPYQISTPQELYNIRFDMYAHYKLIKDIDLTYDTSNKDGLFYNDGNGWLPISYDPDNTIYDGQVLFEGNEFNGVLDGNGFSIIGLHINRYNSDFNGLFGYVGSAGVVKNLKLANADVQGNHATGIVAGYNSGIINNVITSGIVHFEKEIPDRHIYIGGITGINAGIIDKVYNFAEVKSVKNYKFYEIKCGGVAALNGSDLIFSSNSKRPVYIKNSINFGKIISINKDKSDDPRYASQYASAAGVVVYNASVILNVANFEEIYGNNAVGLVDSNSGIIYNAYNAGKLRLYKEAYTGNEKLKKYNTIYYSDMQLYKVFGLDLSNDDELTNEYRGPFYWITENNGEWRKFNSITMSLNSIKNSLSTFDFVDSWEYYDGIRFPLIKGMPIVFPTYNKKINDELILIDESELSGFNYKLNYEFDNLVYDYLIFESSSPKVIIDKEGVIKLNVQDSDAVIETTITIKTVLSNQTVSKQIVFKINRISLRDVITSYGYQIKNNFVYGFILNDKIEDIQIQFGNNINIKNIVDLISTGTEFTYKDEKYVAVIYGDTNGDGEISPLDYVKIKNHIMGDSIITGDEYIEAADANRDNEISPLDYVRVKNYIMNGAV